MEPRENESLLKENSGMELDLLELLFVYLNKWWLIAICAVLGAAIMLAYTILFVTPMYRASVKIYVNNSKSQQNLESVSGSDLSASTRLVKTYIAIAKSDRVLSKMADELGDEYTIGEVGGMISAQQVDETELFAVYASSSDPEEAAAVANAAAKVIPEEMAAIIEGSSAQVIDYAQVPTSRYTPSYTRNTMIGGAAGVLLALIYITIVSLMDIRIKSEEDISNLCDYPLLGLVPEFSALSRKSGYAYEYGYQKSESE